MAHRSRIIRSTIITIIDIDRLMAVELHCEPKRKRAPGERRAVARVRPQLSTARAARLAKLAKALGDPIRLQLVDVLRRHAGEVCVCELLPLFSISQPTLSHHLARLREAGIVGSQRRGLWAYYYVQPSALEEISAWLEDRPRRSP
jgi:ArsR family transcriptional regulator